MALNASVWQFGTIAGPIAAGLLHILGAPVPFVVAAVAAGAGAAAVLLVPASIGRAHLTDEPRSATLHDALEGVRFILRTPALLGTMSLDLVAVLLGGATALLPVFSQEVLHVGAFGNGVLRAAPGIGAVVVALALAARPSTSGSGPRSSWPSPPSAPSRSCSRSPPASCSHWRLWPPWRPPTW